MKKISGNEITEAVKKLFLDAVRLLPQDVCDAFDAALKNEEAPLGRMVLEKLIENKEVAKAEELALCQDTGFSVIFVEWGEKVVFEGENLAEAINEGVRQAYSEGYFRKSIVNDPIFDRKNTGDNTPAVINFEIVPGENVRIIAAPKGGGSENMSVLKMLKPSDGLEGVKQTVIEAVDKAGGNPCPPVIVGVGVGGTAEKATLLAKKAVLREIGKHNGDGRYAKLEQELLTEINKLGIGPMGFGGTVTAIAVNIEYFPCHIASLPVAVNIQCNSARHKEIIL